MGKNLRYFLLITIFFILSACSDGGHADSSKNEDTIISYLEFDYPIEVPDSIDLFSFIVISDTQLRLPGNPGDAVYNNEENLNNLSSLIDLINDEYYQSDFVVVTGDLVGCLYSDEVSDYNIGEKNPAETFKEMMDKLIIPYYVVLGNHDYQKNFDDNINEGIMTENISNMEDVWNKVLGIQPYYSIVHKGIRFIFLNSNRGAERFNTCPFCEKEAFCTGSFDNDQLDWLEMELNEPEPCLLFFHHPVKTDRRYIYFCLNSYKVAEEDEFYDIAELYKHKIHGIFVGHGHVWAYDTFYDEIPVFETAATGDRNSNEKRGHIITVNPYGDKYTLSRMGDE